MNWQIIVSSVKAAILICISVVHDDGLHKILKERLAYLSLLSLPHYFLYYFLHYAMCIVFYFV